MLVRPRGPGIRADLPASSPRPLPAFGCQAASGGSSSNDDHRTLPLGSAAVARTARAAALPVSRYRRAADRRSRAQRWRDAAARLWPGLRLKAA
jgi:hypothetical protein